MLRAFCRMYEASIKHQRLVICPCLTTFWRSVCLNQGTMRLGGGCFKPTWNVCREASRAPAAAAVLRALGLGTRHQSRAKDEEMIIILTSCAPLCASPRAHTTGRRLLQTDLERV